MIRRRLPYRVLLAAATLAIAPVGGARAQSQDVGLRGLGNIGGTAGSPGQPLLSTPERVSSPSTDASPAAADEDSPTKLTPPQNEPDPGAPNYGKPRKRKPKLYKPNPKGSLPLSPLVPYRGSPGQKKVLNPPPPPKDAIDPVQPAPTVAVIPSPLRVRRPTPEIDPFAPIGVRYGELILRPFVETSAGYETNPNQLSVGVKPSPALRADGGLDVNSDFSSGSLIAVLRGGYTDFPANSAANRPDLNAVIDGRIDVTRQDTINTEARFLLQTQQPGSPLLAVPNAVFTTNRPLIVSEGATLGGNHTFNRLTVGLRGTFDRTQYGDAQQSDGTVFRFSQDNYNAYGLVARASYEITPAVSPFVEVGLDQRVRDNAIDLSGFRRDSRGVSGKAGAVFDLIGHFTGTIDGGYLVRHYQDPRLPNLRGPVIDGRLVYAASALTTVTFTASTFASETTLPFASGAISRSFGLELSHVFFSRFTLTGIALVQPNNYQGVPGQETYTTLTLKGAYAVTRDIQLTGTVSHQMLRSTFPGQNFNDNVFLAGVRLQR